MTKRINSDEFIGAFNRMEADLKQKYNYKENDGFKKVIKEVARKNGIVSAHLDLLNLYADLRNTITHTQGTQGKEFIIAEPHTEVVEKIKSLEQLIANPPRVVPTFQNEVLAYESTNSIFDAIKEMADNDYSQMPIVDQGKFVGLLNANTITRWFGATENKEIDSDGSTIIMDTQIKDVLNFQETEDTYKFINRNSFLHDALDHFEKDRNLEALLITHSGDADEALLGIITVWDLFEINNTLKV